MHIESHAGLGWAIGVLSPGSSRRLRNWCLLAAILPDIDTASYLFGAVAYDRYHHTFGHNVFLGLLVAAVGAWHLRREPGRIRWLLTPLPGLCFLSHLLTDMKLSAYTVGLFWPLATVQYEFPNNIGLHAPINTYLIFASGAVTIVLAIRKKVTPLDLFSSRLDRIVLNFFRARTVECATCGRRCNERCDGCGEPTCLLHGRIGLGFRIWCPDCATGKMRGRALSIWVALVVLFVLLAAIAIPNLL